jgi:hypothetical protein
MILEFQLSSDTLGRIVRNLLHNIDLCVKDSFTFLNNQWMIDRILVLPTTSLGRQPASVTIHVNDYPLTLEGCSKAVLAQPLQLNIVKVSDLTANGPSPTTPAFSPQFTILLDITASVENGEAILQFSFNSIDFETTQPETFKALIDPATQTWIQNLVGSKVPPVKRKIDVIENLQSIPILKDILLSTTNAGVTASKGGEILLLRVEMNGAAEQVPDWRNFYTYYNRNLVGTGNWAMLIDKDILILAIKKTIGASLADVKDKFALDGGINVSWKPAVGPVFDIEFSGEVIDACTCLWGEIDVNVDVSTTIDLQAGSADTIYMGATTTYDSNDLEVACCALTATAFWPVVGLIYMGKDEASINLGTYLLGYVLSPLGFSFIAVCVLAGNQSITKYLTLPGGCKKVDDETFSCQWPFAINMGAFGGMFHLTGVSAQSEGPVLSGTTSGISELNDPQLAMKSLNQFAWHLGGSCNIGFSPQLTGGILYNDVAFGSIFKVCDVAVLEDPLHIFKIVKVGELGTTVRAVLSNAYLANPYPCKLQIVSNGGVRIITLAPAKEITEQEVAQLQGELSVAETLCHALSISVPIKIIKWMQPDPPYPFTIENGQIWQAVIAELTEGESVDLLIQGRVMATAFPNGRGVAQLSLWSEGQDYHDEIGLRLNVSGTHPAPAERDERKRHVSVKQSQLVLRSQVAFAGNFEEMAFSEIAGQSILSIRTSDGEVRYDVTVPDFPSLWSSRIGGGLALREVCARYDFNILHEGEELRIVDREGSTLSTIPCPSPGLVAVVRDYLFVARTEGVEAYKLSRQATLERVSVSKLAVEGITRIEPVRIAGVKRALGLIDRTGITRIIDVSDLSNVNEIGRYFHTPWFVEARRSGQMFGKLASDRRHISIYEVQWVIDS